MGDLRVVAPLEIEAAQRGRGKAPYSLPLPPHSPPIPPVCPYARDILPVWLQTSLHTLPSCPASVTSHLHTPAQANHAIAKLNETELQGRRIHVRPDREGGGGGRQGLPSGMRSPPQMMPYGGGMPPMMMGGGGGQGGRGRCYVGNLAYGVGWQDLKDLFRSVGRVVHADVMQEDNGRSKGYGIVEFESRAEVRPAPRNWGQGGPQGRLDLILYIFSSCISRHCPAHIQFPLETCVP